MRFLLYLMIVLTGSAALYAHDHACTCGHCSSVPELFCEHSAYDAGSQHTEAQIEHTFTLNNQGSAPLVIERLETCCGAMAVMDNRVIAPGGSQKLSLSASLGSVPKKYKKRAFLTTNDPKTPVLTLEILAEVDHGISMTPAAVDFKRIEPGSRTQQVVHVSGLVASSEVFRVVNTSNWFQVERQTVAGGGEDILIRPRDTLQPGLFESELEIFTSDPQQPLLIVPVSAMVAYDLMLFPQELRLESWASSTGFIYLCSRSGTPFEILDIDSPVAGLKVKSVPAGNGRVRLVFSAEQDGMAVLEEASVEIKVVQQGKRYSLYLPITLSNDFFEKKVVSNP